MWEQTCLYKQKHTIASTSPTISSLLSTLKALILQLRSFALGERAWPLWLAPAKAVVSGPFALLREAVTLRTALQGLAVPNLQRRKSSALCVDEKRDCTDYD